MRKRLAPLDLAPVSVHAPFVCHPGGQYRHEPVEERRAALLAALDGVALGAYDARIMRWPASQVQPVPEALEGELVGELECLRRPMPVVLPPWSGLAEDRHGAAVHARARQAAPADCVSARRAVLEDTPGGR